MERKINPRSLENLVAGKNKSPRQRKQVKLLPETIKAMSEAGSGSISDGIDRLAGQQIKRKNMYTLKKQADGLLWLFVGDQVKGTLAWRNEDEGVAQFLEDSAFAFPRSEIANVDEFPQLVGEQWFAIG